MKTAKDVMTPNPTSCKTTSSVREAVEVMKREDCGVVPVVDEQNKCVGIITDRDICLKVILDRKDPNTTTLQEVMTRNPITSRPDESLDTIIQKMEKYMVRRIPIVDENNYCKGIISEADLALKADDKKRVADMVEAVSR